MTFANYIYVEIIEIDPHNSKTAYDSRSHGMEVKQKLSHFRNMIIIVGKYLMLGRKEDNWRKMSGVLCDKRVPPHVKGKIHKIIVQPAMLYGMETVPVTSSHVKKLEVTGMKMCRWACGHTLRDHVRNENIKERLKVESIAERCRKARLRWFGHVKRRDQEYVGRKTLEMVPPGRKERGRPNQRWMDCINQDI